MTPSRTASSEPIAGYRLIELLGCGGFGEVWKCEAPGGLLKAIKFVAGSVDVLAGDGSRALRELKSLQLIKSLRHPFLLAMDRVEVVDDDLVIVMELADRSLHDLLVEYRDAGRSGIPRDELLGYLHETAEVLDLMNQEYGLQHLDVKPRNLFLVARHVKVADFGLVNSLADLSANDEGSSGLAASPLYAAAEVFRGQVTPFSDQYSLAVTYQELLTGTFPFSGKSAHQLAMQHRKGVPDLQPLPESDRPILRRALARDPGERFASCSEFVAALKSAAPTEEPSDADQTPTPFDVATADVSTTRLTADSSRVDVPLVGQTATAANAVDPVAQYRFLECLSRAPTGEMWTVQGPTGPPCLLRYVTGFDPDTTEAALARWENLRHDILVPADVLRCSPGRLALVHEVFDAGLIDRLRLCQQQGLPGIPRAELLDILFDVARALDELYRDHQLRHLSLSPRTVVLRRGKPKLLDFGLTDLFWLPAGHNPAEFNTRYAAPELFDIRHSTGPSRKKGDGAPQNSDQYSLALLFVEMLTGLHPLRNFSPRQMATLRLRAQPDLMLLTGTDRDILLRALHADPQRRFGSNLELVEALDRTEETVSRAPPTRTVSSAVMRAVVAPPNPRQRVRDVLAPLIEAASEDAIVYENRGLRYLELPGPILEFQGCASVVPGTARLRLDGFREQWKGRALGTDAGGFVFELSTTGNLWQRCLGATPALELRIHLATSQASLTELRVAIKPKNCSSAQAKEMVRDVAPRVLESLHQCLQVLPDRRREARLPLEMDVEVRPLAEDGEMGRPMHARICDISWNGMGLILSQRLPGKKLLIQVPQLTKEEVGVPGRIVHGKVDAYGRFTVGVSFAVEEG
jgi:serine/threonine protein kinase